VKFKVGDRVKPNLNATQGPGSTMKFWVNDFTPIGIVTAIEADDYVKVKWADIGAYKYPNHSLSHVENGVSVFIECL
jgi:hypothetical protein